MGVTDVMSGYLMLVLRQLSFVLFKEDGTKRKSADREAYVILYLFFSLKGVTGLCT
jgi:hypothetical protein